MISRAQFFTYTHDIEKERERKKSITYTQKNRQ